MKSQTKSQFLFILKGLCSEKNIIKCKVILSGDVKQLDAVTTSTKAAKLGYNKSWMEYLSSCPCYGRNQSGRYYSTLTVQLTKNYRSHPNILSKPSEMFYEGVLEAEAPEGNDVLDVNKNQWRNQKKNSPWRISALIYQCSDKNVRQNRETVFSQMQHLSQHAIF